MGMCLLASGSILASAEGEIDKKFQKSFLSIMLPLCRICGFSGPETRQRKKGRQLRLGGKLAGSAAPAPASNRNNSSLRRSPTVH